MLKVALIHDWLNGMRGGEKVFEVLCEIYPQADVFTLFYEPERVSPLIRSMRVRESPLPRVFPAARRHYRWLLPLMPTLIEETPIRGYDIVISTSHCVAKGAYVQPLTTPHICYCFTPMRYVWDKYDDYFGGRRGLAGVAMPFFRQWLQEWDVESSARVSHFLTSSEYVRDRIRRHYMRDAVVIPPPIEFEKFGNVERAPTDHYLVVSALEPYKRVDIVVEAFRGLDKKLIVAGSGSQLKKLRKIAGPNVEFRGWVSDDELAQLYASARALIFPADEDFGIVPLEACAAGCPVLAYGHGGALETLVNGATGAFFPEQTAESVREALERFDSDSYDTAHMKKHAEQFDRAYFKRDLAITINQLSKAPAARRNGT